MARLHDLLQAHAHLVDAAKLPEYARPYSVQSRLEELEKQLMEEFKTPAKPKAIDTDDNIPF